VDAIMPASSDPLVVLQERLASEINATCTDLDTARKLAETALAGVGLEDWTVTVRPDTRGCVIAGQDPETQSVYLFSLPS
jgi:hypothetical protein